ncbi:MULTISPECIES: terminase gpA endonuclease subunit [unclassified Agrobacterium]
MTLLTTLFEQKVKPKFRSLEAMLVETSAAVRPPERLSVSESAQKYRYIDGLKWDNSTAPYLKEPMDMLGSLDHTGMVLVGPARCGKSEVGLNWLNHSALCDPADMMIVHMKRDSARDWSNKELQKFINQNAKIREQLLDRNTHDLRFRNGMDLLIKWPTITEFSGKTVQRMVLNDYDHMPPDIDGEGPAWDLAKMRTFTFRRFGMTYAEGSPGRELDDPKWIPNSKHQAPPAKGIMEVYNKGDRRRLYWRCLSCGNGFEPDFSCMNYPDTKDFLEAGEMATMRCPHCQHDHLFEDRQELNENAKWLRDGQYMDDQGNILGNGVVSDIASFWLKGPVAKYQTWAGLVVEYLRAQAGFEATGDEGALRKFTNTNLGMPYIPRALANARTPETLMERADNWGSTKEEPTVPAGVRFLEATVDIQSGSRRGFVVQVTGFGVGGDAWIIDMFRLLKSERLDESGDRLPMNPAAYAEDWDLLIDRVINKTYPLADGSGRRMSIKITGCDYGGEDGVSVQAREFWRRLRNEHGLSNRFALVKGMPNRNIQTASKHYPDAQQKDKLNTARGDVPVWYLNSNELKDTLAGQFDRTDAAGGRWTFPHWAEPWLYSQLTAENRTDKGWEPPKNNRRHNEAWDLSYYALGLLRHEEVRATRIGFWDSPPPWAAPWDENILVFGEKEEPAFHAPQKKSYDFGALAKTLA